MVEKKNIRAIPVEELTSFLIEHGEKAFRAKQIEEWIWVKRARSFQAMTNLSKDTRALLEKHYQFDEVKIDSETRSSDGTIKLAFQLHDGNLVEGVLIPGKNRMTACISSQVGCNLACSFCATGMIRYIRNIDPWEIFDQVALIDDLARQEYQTHLSNIVYMGMGEPLLNYHNVLESINRITSENGMGMSPRRITVSTVGIAPMIKQLGKDKVRFNFALSLHVADDEKRDKLIPYNRRNSIKDLIEAMKYFHQETGTRPTIEYIMLRGFNDTEADAANLASFCKNFPVKVNLIQYNPVENAPYEDSGDERIERFKELLEQRNMIVNVRHSRGKDIDAACGQLANKILNNTMSKRSS